VNTVTVLLGVLLVVASALCAVAIWAVTEFVKTAKSMRTLSDDLDQRLVPLLDKADVTVDAANAELLRIDGIVTRMEEVTDRVSATSRTVQEVANAPVEIVTDFADRVRHAWKTRKAPTSSPGSAVRADESDDEAPAENEASSQFTEVAETPASAAAGAVGATPEQVQARTAGSEEHDA